MTTSHAIPTTYRRLALAAVALCVSWAVMLGGRPLLDPDEGRYAEIPREMLTSGDWVTPHLNGLVYLEKPPLQYWATAVLYRVFGVEEWSARLWTGLTSLLTIAAVYVFAARTWGRREGLWAAGILASSTLFMLIGHQLTLDASMTFFLTLALLAFCDAQLHRHRPRAARLTMLLCWAAMGAAVLTKGIIGILIPGAVLVLYSVWQRDWDCWRYLNLRFGLPLFALIVAPWFVLAARANSEFLQFFFLHEHFQRFFTLSADRYQPWWYFLVILAAGSLPWLPHTMRALLGGGRRREALGAFDVRRVLWLWCVFVLVFFSASQSKLSPYILPMFPALALLIAGQRQMDRAGEAKSALAVTLVVIVALLVCAQMTLMLGRDPTRIAAWRAFQPKLYGIAATLFLGVVCGAWALHRQRVPRAALILGAAWFLSVGLLLKSMGPLNPLYSAKSLARKVVEGHEAAVPVYSVNLYRHSLPFYWRRDLTLVDYRGELALGLDHAPPSHYASLKDFKRQWTQIPDALAVMPSSLYQELIHEGLPMRVVAESGDVVIVDRR